MKQRTYIAIDLKSFYASVECRERGLDPMDTNGRGRRKPDGQNHMPGGYTIPEILWHFWAGKAF